MVSAAALRELVRDVHDGFQELQRMESTEPATSQAASAAAQQVISGSSSRDRDGGVAAADRARALDDAQQGSDREFQASFATQEAIGNPANPAASPGATLQALQAAAQSPDLQPAVRQAASEYLAAVSNLTSGLQEREAASGALMRAEHAMQAEAQSTGYDLVRTHALSQAVQAASDRLQAADQRVDAAREALDTAEDGVESAVGYDTPDPPAATPDAPASPPAAPVAPAPDPGGSQFATADAPAAPQPDAPQVAGPDTRGPHDGLHEYVTGNANAATPQTNPAGFAGASDSAGSQFAAGDAAATSDPDGSAFATPDQPDTQATTPERDTADQLTDSAPENYSP